jgi:hypothetical protein
MYLSEECRGTFEGLRSTIDPNEPWTSVEQYAKRQNFLLAVRKEFRNAGLTCRATIDTSDLAVAMDPLSTPV